MHENYGNSMMPRTVDWASAHALFDPRACHSQYEIAGRFEIISLPSHASFLASMFLGAWAGFGLARQLHAAVDRFHDRELLPVGMLLALTSQDSVMHNAHDVSSRQLASLGWANSLPRWPAGPVGQASGQTDRVQEMDTARIHAKCKPNVVAIRWHESGWPPSASYRGCLS